MNQRLSIPLVLALLGVGASWGVSKASVSELNQDMSVVQSRVRDLELKDAADQERYKQIMEKLDEIQTDINELNIKLDKRLR